MWETPLEFAIFFIKKAVLFFLFIFSSPNIIPSLKWSPLCQSAFLLLKNILDCPYGIEFAEACLLYYICLNRSVALIYLLVCFFNWPAVPAVCIATIRGFISICHCQFPFCWWLFCMLVKPDGAPSWRNHPLCQQTN